MSIEIEQSLNKNVLDFLILQTIAECKLNRSLTDTRNELGFSKFYNNYIANGSSFYNLNGLPNEQLINQFKVALGAIPNLAEAEAASNVVDYTPISTQYEGGAGTYTRLPESQIDYFIQNYQIVDYHGNDNTGFSATVFKDLRTGVKTISFRSTEYGEDFSKDANGADLEIKNNGTAFAQTAAMIKYVEQLKTNGVLLSTDVINISGYSLGGHLASNFYKMYSNEFSIGEMYNFNAPGVGALTQSLSGLGTDPYLQLKEDLKQFDVISNAIKAINTYLQFTTLDIQPLSLESCTNIINTDSTLTISQKNLANEFLTFISSVPTNFLNVIIGNFTNSNLNFNPENELSKLELRTQPNNVGIYNDTFYNNYKLFLIDKYEASKAGTTFDGELVDPSFYGNKATWISGLASNDYKIVAESNMYVNPIDIIIEDRPEAESYLGQLPGNIIGKITQFLKTQGDYGNTHSITALNKSLSLMNFLATIEGASTIDVKKYTALISSVTTERATKWVPKEFNDNSYELNYGENNSIAFVVNSLYKALNLKTDNYSGDIVFDNTLQGWGDINKIDDLNKRQTAIINALGNTHIVIESLYNIIPNDLDTNWFGPLASEPMLKTKEDIYTKLLQNDNEGMAYRYALENLNPFIILGLDYDNIDFDSKQPKSQTEQWYKTRIDVLLNIIQQNVINNGDYLANKNVLVDDNNQGFTFNYYANKSQFFRGIESNGQQYLNDRQLFNDNKDYYEIHAQKYHVDFQNYSNENSKNAVFDSSIFYLNPLLLSYESSVNRTDTNNEKIFIKPNVSAINDYKDDTSSAIGKMLHTSGPNYSNFRYYRNDGTYIDGLTSNVFLGTGDDYVEISNNEGYATITSTSGKKDYNINTKETTITDVDKTGTITLDGIVLKGGKRVTNSKYEQTYVDENNVTHTITYELYYMPNRKNDLKITHVNTGNKIYISGMPDFGNGRAFNFEFDEIITSTKSLNIDTSGLENNQQMTDKTIAMANQYASVASFNSVLDINTGIVNAVATRIGNALWAYDKLDPTKKVIIDDYFNSSLENTKNVYTSSVFAYSYQVNGETVNVYEPINGTIDLDFNVEQALIKTPIVEDNITTIDYTINDAYYLKDDTNRTELKRNNLDLIITDNYYENIKTTIVKNYFAFDHQITTNLYLGTNIPTLMSVQEVINYLNIKLTDSNDNYIANINQNYFLYNGGNGDDTLVGTSKDEEFQSMNGSSKEIFNVYNQNTQIAPTLIVDGNDTFTGGGGADIFRFNGQFGNDIITDFDNNDTIYIDEVSLLETQTLAPPFNNILKMLESITVKDNDLIIKYSKRFYQSATDDFMPTNFGTITLKDYLLNVDYKTDTRLGIPASMIIDQIKTIELKEANYIQDVNNKNVNIINANTDNNEITITRNNAVINGFSEINQTSTPNQLVNDGDDIYNLDISETVPTNKNTFRTEVNLGLNIGNDIIKKGIFKGPNQYGDIINLKNVTLEQVIFSKIMENNVLKYIKVQLLDDFKSTILIEVKPDIVFFAQILKIDSQILNLATILNSIPLDTVIYGDDFNNEINQNLTDRQKYLNYEIHAGKGNDIIKGQNGNDKIFGDAGNDTIYLSTGQDEYTFMQGSGIDKIVFQEGKPEFNITFILDTNYLPSDLKYAFDAINKKIYIKFSNQDGIVFEDVEIFDLVRIYNGINFKDINGTIIPKPVDYDEINESPFATSYIEIDGTNNDDFLMPGFMPGEQELNYQMNGGAGNDVIIGALGNDKIIGGEGFDEIILSDGNDQYIFMQGSDIDTFIFDYNIPDLNITFIIDNNYNMNDLKFQYNADEEQIYIAFSENDGVIFENAELTDIAKIQNGLTIKYLNETEINIPTSFDNVIEKPFIPRSETINGTINDDEIVLLNHYNTLVFSGDGEDTIISNGSPVVNTLIIAGQGNDIIHAEDNDILTVKDGDGSDTIISNSSNYIINILRDESRIVNSEETLFDLSVGSGTNANDLILNYGTTGSSDEIIMKDFFDSFFNSSSVSIYEESENKTKIYTLDEILTSLNMTRESLQTSGAVSIKKTDVQPYEESDIGKILGGEISYNYLNNGTTYTDENKTSTILGNISSDNLYSPKI